MSTLLPAINALGTVWFVEIFDEMTTEKTDETHHLVRLFLSQFEAKYSRFKIDSAIGTLNRIKKLESPDQTTIDLLSLGQKFFTDTAHVFNILVGEHLQARGYDSNYSFVPKPEPDSLPDPTKDIIITDDLITLQAGLIDLGGYGKGYLIDRLADLLREHGFHYFLINGGGDMYVTSDHDTPITIYLEHPSIPDTYIAKTTLRDQGFAASSTHKRRWKVSEKEYSHIVDTVNDKSTDSDSLGIYTKAKTAVVADAWATTLLISAPQNHKKTLEQEAIDYAIFDTADSTLTESPNFKT